jgi:hypothetical protein
VRVRRESRPRVIADPRRDDVQRNPSGRHK